MTLYDEGTASALDEKTGDMIMTLEHGGEVKERIEELVGNILNCTCEKSFVIEKILGYLHEAGATDKDKNAWWLYIVCPHCEYQWSLWKTQNRITKQICPECGEKKEGDRRVESGMKCEQCAGYNG